MLIITHLSLVYHTHVIRVIYALRENLVSIKIFNMEIMVRYNPAVVWGFEAR